MQLERLLESFRVHIPGIALGVYVNGNAPLIHYGVHRSVEGDVAADDLAAEEATSLAFTNTRRGTVDLARCKLDGKMKRSGTAA